MSNNDDNFGDISLDKIRELCNDIIELLKDTFIAMCKSKCAGSHASCLCIQ